MQFTGLLDKKRIGIYEGDIVKYRMYDIMTKQEGKIIARVAHYKGSSVVTQLPIGEDDFEYDDELGHLHHAVEGTSLIKHNEAHNTLEIIGNIYENKELLKRGEQND